ncbi:hypothetical protein H4Q26_018122 [Puccinia striiformis f. sp. tritici PST-130]|uniref:Uncharacterized protein n=1 Tax=Puccinia striiformis f. sp. tritici PST-78 TaxID=1165861 RepID=A0A0L0UT18_9BASI|nr:hypothetical protein H4Q26_018122 [Puccinia striiformis f. sp. tritici PST-130]KNE90056.1 hypothetical protein PSTG_16501 [Puccinia striiformis f. sp. tritici PST-78]
MAPSFDQSTISQMVNYDYSASKWTNNSSSFASLDSPWGIDLRNLGGQLQIPSLDAKFQTRLDQAASLSISLHFFNTSGMLRNHQD